MRFQTILLSLLLACAGAADVLAKATESPVAGLESVFIMQVDGWIVIDPQGKVVDYQRETKVPDNLSEPISQAVHAWLFKPVVIDGAPVQAKAKMRITLAAQKSGEAFHVVVDNVIFPSGGKDAESENLEEKSAYKPQKLTPPDYPVDLLRAGIAANVQVALQVGQDGKVINVCVVQSALPKLNGKPSLLTAALEQFEKSALVAARKWAFTVDQARLTGADDILTATVTINYTIVGAHAGPKPAAWSFETRTAKRDIPWVRPEANTQHVGVSDSNAGELIPIASAIQLASSPVGQAL